MYIPSTNLMTDRDEIIEFMKRFSFATIISNKNGVPIATHLPFIVETIEQEIILTSHFAKANEQWEHIQNQTVLVIFSEPHAYISTSNYDKELNVPTWNYLSVHAYGKAELVTDYDKTIEILEKTINNYERSFTAKWKEFPQDYKERMAKGIVGFQLSIIDLQAKKKLSQNRTETEKMKIIETLGKSHNSNEVLIGKYMKNEIR
jgi:transcriptional regulator